MSHVEAGPLSMYNSLTDKHLSGYFANTRMRKHLNKAGLVTRRGQIVTESTYRLNMARKEHKKHVKDLLAQAIVHKTLDMERYRQVEIKRKLEEISKIELVRRVRSLKVRKNDADLLPLLSPRASRPQSGPSARSKPKRHRKARPASAPAHNKKYMSMEDSHRSSGRIYVDQDGNPVSPSQVNERDTGRDDADQDDVEGGLSKAEIDTRHLYALDTVALRKYAIMMSRHEQGKNSVSPYLMPQVGYQIPTPPKSPRSQNNTARSRGRKTRVSPRESTGARSASPPQELDHVKDSPKPTPRRNSAIDGQLMIHRSEPAMKGQEKVQSLCTVTMKYHGKNLTLPRDQVDPYQEVLIEQQHCGGNTLPVFKERLLPGATFRFVSRRHRGYPFSLSLYIDGMMDCRVSSCCEYKHPAGAKLGGKQGHFTLSGVSGAAPCYRCQVEKELRLQKKQKDKKKRGTEEVTTEEKQEETTVEVPEEDKYEEDFEDEDDEEKKDEKTNETKETKKEDETEAETKIEVAEISDEEIEEEHQQKGYEGPNWLEDEVIEEKEEPKDNYELRDGRKIEGYSSEEEYLDKDNKTVTEVEVHHGSGGLEQPRGQRDFESDSDSESAKSVSSRSESSKSASPRSRSPSPKLRSRSPSPKTRSRSPSPKRRSRSPSPKRRSRSPSPNRRSRSPSPKPVEPSDWEEQEELKSENAVRGIDEDNQASVTTDKRESVDVIIESHTETSVTETNDKQEMSDTEVEREPEVMMMAHFDEDEEFDVVTERPIHTSCEAEKVEDRVEERPEMAREQSFDRPKTARDKRRLPGDDEAPETPKHEQSEAPSILIFGEDSQSNSSDEESDAVNEKPLTEENVTRFDTSDDETPPDSSVLVKTTTTTSSAGIVTSDSETAADNSVSQTTELGKTPTDQRETTAAGNITTADAGEGSPRHEAPPLGEPPLANSDTDGERGDHRGKESPASSPSVKPKSDEETASEVSSDSDSDSDSVTSTERSTSRSSRSSEDSESEDEAGGRDPDGVADGSAEPKELMSTLDVQRGKTREGSILSLVDNGESVNLSNISLNNDQVKELRDYIEQNGNLKEVVIRNGCLGEVDIQRLSFSLKQSPSEIKLLNLNLNKIGASGAGKIADVLKVKPSIDILMLHGNPLGDDGIKALVDGLLRIHGEEKQSNFIRRLSMEEERMTREATQNPEVYTTIPEEPVEEEERETTPQELTELLTEIDALEKKAQLIGQDEDNPESNVGTTGSEIPESVSVAVLTAAHEVADQLIDSAFREAMKSETELASQGESTQEDGDVEMKKSGETRSDSDIPETKGSSGVAPAGQTSTMSSITEQSFCHLKELDLGKTEMTDVGVGDLAVLLAQNTDLRSLYLTDNKGITQFGWKKLGKGLEINDKLERLTLDYCYVGDNGLDVLADAIKDHPALRTLDLVCTGLTERSGRYLVELLKRNTFLTEITLMPGNDIPERMMDEIRNYLALNQNMLNK